MERPASQRTTRTRRSAPKGGLHLLEAGQVVHSLDTGISYRAGKLIGFGGYGQVYLAKRLGRAAHVPEAVCLKVSPHMAAWVREAYFGQLLDGHPRATRVYDRFTLMSPQGRPIYGLALEWARHGDLSAFL